MQGEIIPLTGWNHISYETGTSGRFVFVLISESLQIYVRESYVVSLDLSVLTQVILYSGELLITRRPPLRWLVYTVMEVFEKSSYSTFTLASEVAQSKFSLIFNRANTLYYSTNNHYFTELLAVFICNKCKFMSNFD